MLFTMSPRSILWAYLASAVAVPAAFVAGIGLAGDRLTHATTCLIGIGVVVLTSVGSVGWAAAYTRATRAQRGTTVAVWIATACLLVGLGSTGHVYWEEYQAGMSLPVINLFPYLIPLGLLILLGSAVAQTAARTSRARGERQR